jgi:hypothetical protein
MDLTPAGAGDQFSVEPVKFGHHQQPDTRSIMDYMEDTGGGYGGRSTKMNSSYSD